MAVLLEQQTPDATRIAHHYLAADERDKALPWRLKAIEEAIVTGFRAQASDWLEGFLFEAPQDSKVYTQALLLKGRLLQEQDMTQAEKCFQEALELSKHRYPELEVVALEGLVQCAKDSHDFSEISSSTETTL
jgi:hypothetical protein